MRHEKLTDKKKKKKKRRRKRDEDEDAESSSDSSSSEGGELFQAGSAVMRVAKEKPGRLYQQGLAEISRLMGKRALPGEAGHTVSPVMISYLYSMVFVQHPVETVGARTVQELRTLATLLDHLARGELDQLGDVAMQRFKALELSIKDKSWTLATELELLPPLDACLTSQSEHQKAAKAALLRGKLEEVRRKVKGNSK